MVPGAEVDACGLFRMLWMMIKFYIKWVKLIGNTNDKKNDEKNTRSYRRAIRKGIHYRKVARKLIVVF